MGKKRNIHFFIKAKKKRQKISAITAYDYNTSVLASQAGIDLILVGDSLGMVIQGRENTIPVTLDQMIYHTRLVTRARPDSFVVGDMPYGSYHVSLDESRQNALRFIKEGGAQAVKLEGGQKRFHTIQALLDIEIPVLGHLGLTPQSIHQLGGFKIQGKLKRKAEQIHRDALAMEKMGVFAIILEAIPEKLGREISRSLKIPTIGIGAGRFCDGQILVMNDVIGLSTTGYIPSFARRYADVGAAIRQSLEHYVRDIQAGDFPAPAETYPTGKP